MKLKWDSENLYRIKDNMEYATPEQIEHFKKLRKSREWFWKWYEEEHECCPKCGSTSHSSTYVGYIPIFHEDGTVDYKDLNSSQCSDCGDWHTIHDRVRKIDNGN